MGFYDLKDEYDIIVAGGGITGAGVFYEAVQRGYKVLLLEARDYAWGTSSRSSKMVHGGLRYLKQGKFFLTKEAVKQRELLLKEYPGLVTPLKYIMPVFGHYGPSMLAMKTGLFIYSLMAGEKQHETYTKNQAMDKISGIRQKNLVSAVGFKDAQVDDARLVLRLIDKGKSLGGMALNYTKVTGFKRDQKGYIAAVNLKDEESGAAFEIKTKMIINATGVCAEKLHPSEQKGFHIRPLRGSHLIFPQKLFPLKQVISFIHPQDLRPVFLFPWEGCIVLGTTDVDHTQDVELEPFVTVKEADYLMEGLKYILPEINLSLKDCIASIAGIRPILSKKNKSASKESREHVVWKDKGLITITGGKLTTFQILANEALKAAKLYLPRPNALDFQQNPKRQNLDKNSDKKWDHLSNDVKERLTGRYGLTGCQKIREYDNRLFARIETTQTMWVEIIYAAEHGNIRHISDLLLRRVRIGLLLPRGGINILDRVEFLCKPYLSWDSKRWYKEKKDYIRLWKNYYSPPSMKQGA
ncbi:MAG: glycerol-3-phosphate dehydrogenase/oxidase [Desulfobacula sp.]|nr:glycerol-3-phosphate dehydrogenase/oxidase [Desulfobacula sp.]